MFRVPEALSQTINGLTFKVNNDGSVTVTGTSTDNTTIDLELESPVVLNGTYTFSIKRTGTGGASDQQWLLYKGTLENKQSLGLYPALNGNVTNTVEATATILRVFTANAKTINCTIYPILEEGSTVTDWDVAETHTTPNPSYEQPIYSAGDNENLFDTSLLPITKNGVTISKDSKGNVVLNGTPTITSGYIGFDFTISSTYLKADTYTISVKNKIDGIGTTINQTTPGGIINLTMSDTAKVKTGTLTADLINGTMGVNVRYDVGTLDNFILNPKLEKGNKATPYSPYGMGSINEKIQNKNWLPNNVVNQTKNGVTITKNNDGTITANGTATAQTEILISSVKLSAGNYLGSIGVTGSTSTYYARLGEGTTSQSPFIANIGTGDNAFTLDETKIIGAVLIIRSGQTLNNVIFKPMIRLASITDNSYVPHEEQDYSIFVQQPMRSIGDIRDCFVKKNSSWYERHYIGEVVFDGSEDEEWRFNATSTTPSNRTVIITNNNLNSKYNVNADYVSNMFIKNSTSSNKFVLSAGLYLSLDDALTGITSNDDNNVKLTKMLTYLSTHNVVVQYELAEPQDLPCTSEQIEALENLPSTYQDFTYVVSEDETPAYLEVSGIYDMNKLITRVEVIESES